MFSSILHYLSFYPLLGSYAFVLGIFLALGIVLIARRPDDERLTKRTRRMLLLLRTAALLILLFAMLRPTLVYTKTQRLSSTLNILLDRSESMSRPDELGGATRFQVARETLLNARPQLKRLQNHSEIEAFTFDASLHSLPIRDGLAEDIPEFPLGKESALGAALDAVRERSSGKRVLGTILLSDGNQQTRPPRDALPHDAALRLRDAGIPLYAVRLGRPSGTPDMQDISVNDIQANDRVFVKNELLISGSARILGYRNQSIPIQLLFEDEEGAMQVVSEQSLRSGEDGQIVPYRFSYAPQRTGYFKYMVRIPPQPKELVDTNNEQSNFVRVVDGGLNVLFIQGERRYEQRPLRQSLDASADIHVDYRSLRIGRAGVGGGQLSFQRRLEAFTAERPSWVEDAFVPGKYNVYILDDLDSKAFKPEELKALSDRIREGAGLILLGGMNAFGAGGYADTPIAELSPVELRTVDRQPLDGPIRRDIHWQEEISMRPTEYGRTHYVMRLAANPAKSEEIWKSLPPLSGANRLDRLKSGALVLAQGPKDERLLISHLFGSGRVLAFAGDSTYRWRLAGFVEEHKRFWRQIVLWLAKMEGVLEGDCWITLENVRLLPGDTAKFQVFLQSLDGGEIKDFHAEATVVKPDGSTERVPLVDEEGIPTGSFRSTDQPGDYTIRVETTSENAPPETSKHSATARFMVFDRNRELDNPIAYPKLLENISTITEGRSVAPEQLNALLDELIERSDEFVEKRITKRTLYDGWGVLTAFLLLLSLEWFLRKHWGLV